MTDQHKCTVERCFAGGEEVADVFVAHYAGAAMTNVQKHIVERCFAGGEDGGEKLLMCLLHPKPY